MTARTFGPAIDSQVYHPECCEHLELIFQDVQTFPVVANDGFAHLRRGLALAALLVAEERLAHANLADGSVLRYDPIQGTAVAAVAVAVARFLIERLLDAGGDAWAFCASATREFADARRGWAHHRTFAAHGNPRAAAGDPGHCLG
jgi:hypothetical protein